MSDEKKESALQRGDTFDDFFPETWVKVVTGDPPPYDVYYYKEGTAITSWDKPDNAEFIVEDELCEAKTLPTGTIASKLKEELQKREPKKEETIIPHIQDVAYSVPPCGRPQEDEEYFFIRSRLNDKVVTVGSPVSTDVIDTETRLRMYPRLQPLDDRQLFYFDRDGNLRSKIKQYGLDTRSGWVEVNTFQKNKHMRWKFMSPRLFLAEQPDLVMDIRRASKKDDAEVVVYNDNGQTNQQWYLDYNMSLADTTENHKRQSWWKVW